MLLTESNLKAKGAVSHRSSLTDPHIKKAIAYLATKTGAKEADIVAKLTEEIKQIEDLRTKSPLLYDAIADNAAEQRIRRMFQELDVDTPEGCATFDPVVFSKLVRRIKAENPSFFPLRNIFNKRPITAPRFILVPTTDKADSKFNNIDTAAATPRGEFIFNTKCCQHDMNLAYVQGVKPKSKKYKSNGGEFPDEWAPVEFTILHEFYHYTHGDFHYMKVLGGNPTIHNWAMDMRSNYDLTKAGHHPYAEGLFSDHINYDKMTTYKEMYEAVKNEFEKLNPKDKKKVEQLMNQMGDDHSQHHGDEEPGQNGQSGGGDGSIPSPDDFEEHGKKVSKNGEMRKDGEQGQPKDANGGGSGGKGGRTSDKSQLTPTAVDWKGIKPRFKWKDLLERMVRDSDSTETTYQKVHRRNVTGVALAAQTGAGVVRPGEKVVPANLVKLCIVIDSSGSMSQNIKIAFANLNKLFAESGISKTFALVEFSNTFRTYSCTMSGRGTGTATEVADVKEIKAATGGAVDLSVILSRHVSGGTNFNTALANHLGEFAKQKYNVLIMSDSDIATGENFQDFKKLYMAHRQNVFAIFDSASTFQTVAQKLGQASAHISHF